MTWQDALAKYYQSHQTLDESNRAWLQAEVVMDAPLLEEMTREQIVATFQVKGRMSHARLIRTLVWQALGLILCGREDPLRGNLRSFHYRFSAPLYESLSLYTAVSEKDPRFQEYLASDPDCERGETAQEGYIDNLCEDVFAEYVAHKIFRYQGPFEVKNANEGKSRLGEGRASLLFFTEKEGLEDYCIRYHDEYRISTMVSRGQPSLVTAEYFADELRAKKIARVNLVGLVDWDPAGFLIAESYRRNFEQLGFGIKGFEILTSLDLFTEHALKTKSYDLTTVNPRRKEIVRKWFDKTKGINGECRGIYANHARQNRVDKKFKDWYQDQVD